VTATLADMTAEFLDVITASVPTKGYLTGAVGYGGHFNPTGKYEFDRFEPFAFEWPDRAGEAVTHIQKHAPTADLYICPYLMKTPERKKGNAIWRQVVHSDCDQGVDLDAVHELGGFAIWSGSTGHGHVYILLRHTLMPAQHEALCRGVTAHLGGDAGKVSDNDLLRPAGAYNHKSAANGGVPMYVVLADTFNVTPVDPFELADTLGIDINAAAPSTNGTTHEAAPSSVDPIDLDAYPSVAEALAHPVRLPDGSIDRSDTTFHVAAVCVEVGLSLAQTRWVIDSDPNLAGRIGSRRDDDVSRAYERASQRSAWIRAAGAPSAGVPVPPVPTQPRQHPAHPALLKDAFIGEYIADDRLAGEYLYSGVFKWMRFDGKVWRPTDEAVVGEVIRLALIAFVVDDITAGADADRRKVLIGLLSASRMRGIMSVARGRVAREGIAFDAHPWLINAGNGVVDLRDGSLIPHHPDLLFTKVTPVDYYPAATHPDWDKALTAVSPEVGAWLQERFGQGLTGFPPPDDKLVILKGAGENGKSTVMDGINAGAGEYATSLPDRVLLARSGDHPTELMELRDARLAFMEEFPEIGHLNVRRLKAITGTQMMNARYCGGNNIEWESTHTVFVTSNYLPRVEESDHGTWRRLALIEFPHRYRKPAEAIEGPNDRRGDPGLRDRIRAGDRGQHEAALAWLVRGAMNWFANGRVMTPAPHEVVAATETWRGTADLLGQYMEEKLVLGMPVHVMATDLYNDFAEWLKAHGQQVWGDQNFNARFSQHRAVLAANLEKKKIRPGQTLSRPFKPGWGAVPTAIPQQYWAWIGIGFQDPNQNPGITT
jgi:putative DNA primase/helicase